MKFINRHFACGGSFMDTLQNCIDRLQTAISATMRKLGPQLAEDPELGLTGPQYFILRLLSRKGKCMVSELAKEMNVKPSAITGMIERLHKNELVNRQRDEIDRRVVFIEISEKGVEVLREADHRRKKIIAGYLRQLDRAELESFVAIWEKISKIVTADANEKEKQG
jgi:DNA-binding MarR family transcriptional regulator